MSPRKLVPLVVILAAALGTLLYARARQKPKDLVLAGTLEARTVSVGSLVGGRVLRVHVDEGSRVAAGQLVVTLETDPIDRKIAEQRAAVTAAKAALDKALAGPRGEEIRKAAAVAEHDERERRRMEALLEQGVVARQLYDVAATKAKTSAEELRILREGTRREDIAALRAELDRQQRRLDTLLEQRTETDVRSSVDGVVQSFGLRPGDLVAPNQSVAEILEDDQLWVRIYVPETLLGLVRIGQPVKIGIDTFPDERFPGRVVAINPQGEYTPRNIQTRAQRAEQVFGVKVDVERNPKLKPGMAAEVDLGVKGRAE